MTNEKQQYEELAYDVLIPINAPRDDCCCCGHHCFWWWFKCHKEE